MNRTLKVKNKFIQDNLRKLEDTWNLQATYNIDTKLNKKNFTKNIMDKEITKIITEKLSLSEYRFLNYILDFLRIDNKIDFMDLQDFYEYNHQKMSKFKKPLKELWLIKKSWRYFYLNPIFAYKEKNVSNFLNELFRDTYKNFWLK